jgi:hypothetical protein
MFYELIFQSILLGRVAGPVVFHQENASPSSEASDCEIRWFEPSKDSDGRYGIRPIGFWKWLWTRKLRTQLHSEIEVIYLTRPKTDLWARLRVAIFGLNTAFLKPSFPDLSSARIQALQKERRALPAVRLHEQTRCGVHRAFELRRHELRTVPCLTLESISPSTGRNLSLAPHSFRQNANSPKDVSVGARPSFS